MDIFRQAKAELNSAERAISTMKNAKTFDEFEDAWKSYLNNIEKCWVKVERACQHKRNVFQPWQGKYAVSRKKDMLLRYIKHARNVDQHTFEETVKHVPGGFALKHPGGSGFVKSFKMEKGVITEYIGSPLIVENYPSQIELLKIKDSGNWYNPPTQHLDENLEKRDPIYVAEKGLEFYNQFLKEAEEKFADKV
ncbi:MAG: hypothetical protein ACR2MG_02820 [Pyrinomonadaceae bacterium]